MDGREEMTEQQKRHLAEKQQPQRRLKVRTRQMLAVLRGIASGNTISLACEKAGISATTFWLWRKKFPRIATLTDGLITSRIQTVEDSLFESCLGGNVTAMIFFLTNRCPERWADRRALVNNTNVYNARSGTLPKDEPEQTVEQILAHIDKMREDMIHPDELEDYRARRRLLFPPTDTDNGGPQK